MLLAAATDQRPGAVSAEFGMMAHVPSPSTAPLPLVGRAAELDRLAAAVGLSAPEAPGEGRAVLLGGDAGVGKTRLLAELRDRAQAAGWRVLVGHCLDFGDSAVPYLPFTELFARLSAEAPAVVRSLVESRPAVARLVPADLHQPDGIPRTPQQTERVDRADLLGSVQSALAQLGGLGPVLILVEDVHWSDRSTREMLTFLFTRGVPGPVSVVASYRTDDLHRRHPLRATLAEWGRLPQLERIQLGALPDTDMRMLVRALHPAPMPEQAVRRIVDRADGNAFFAEELVAAADMDGRALPTDLADLLLVRLEQLDDPARIVVRAASVAGRRVSHALLARVATVDEGALDRALRAAVEGNVLIAVGEDSYAFRHALLSEAVYDDLLPGERVRLHAAYAAALADPVLRGTSAELARHARAAHDTTTALRASVQAGDDAMAVGGPDEALMHYEVALELGDDAAGAAEGETDLVDPVELSVRASRAALAAGHVFRAVALVRDRLDALAPDEPPVRRAMLLHALASAASLADVEVDAYALTSEALELVPADPPTALRARIAATHAFVSAGRRRDDALHWAAEAMAIGRVLGLADVVGDAATTLAHLEQRDGDPEASRRSLERTVAEAREAGEVEAELRALYHLGSLHYEWGRLAEAAEVYGAGIERANATGRQWAPYGVDARVLAGIVHYVAGDWDQAARRLQVKGESPPPLAEALLAADAMSVSVGRGDDRPLELLPVLRPWWERDGMIAILSGAAAIDLYGDRGDLSAAIAVHDEVVDTVGRLWHQPTFAARIRLSALLLGHLAAEAQRSSGVERMALAAKGSDLAAAAEAAAAFGMKRWKRRGPEGDAWLARVAAEHARLRWLTGSDAPDEADLVAAWEAAVSGFERFGHVFETARSRARLAAVLRAVGRADEARDHVAAASEVARRLGAEPLLAELRAVGGGSARGAARTGSASTASRRDEALTDRESEVLALVAQGRSNREIGNLLYISAKTVSVHVSNILAKLGAAGRTEAVAIARRRGLLPDEG